MNRPTNINNEYPEAASAARRLVDAPTNNFDHLLPSVDKKKDKAETRKSIGLVALGLSGAIILAGYVGGQNFDKDSQAKQDKIQETIDQSNRIDHQIAVENGEYDQQLPMLEPYVDPADTTIPSPKQGVPDHSLPSVKQIGDSDIPAVKTR